MRKRSVGINVRVSVTEKKKVMILLWNTPKQHQKFQRLELQKAGIFIERTFVKLPEYMLTARPRSADHIPFTAQKILLPCGKIH